MKHHLNTLFVTRQGSALSKDGECVELRHEGAILGKIPIHTLDSLICFGGVSLSPYLLDHCAKNGVTVSWFSEYGRFMASMHGPTTGNVLLRKAQYRQADSEEGSVALARSFILGKVSNCRTVLLRHNRQSPDPGLEQAVSALGSCLNRLNIPQQLEVLRGIEGEAAHIYFGVFDKLLSSTELRFEARSRRPPRNEVNCLLSFFYTLLCHDMRSALEGVGLDPAVGFLHRVRPGRPSLALDMMEEFRPYMADRLTLTLLNRKQIQKRDFTRTESGAVLLKENPRRELLALWQERKQEKIEHPFLKESMSVGFLWHMQARLLARYLRGDLDGYPPFVMR